MSVRFRVLLLVACAMMVGVVVYLLDHPEINQLPAQAVEQSGEYISPAELIGMANRVYIIIGTDNWVSALENGAKVEPLRSAYNTLAIAARNNPESVAVAASNHRADDVIACRIIGASLQQLGGDPNVFDKSLNPNYDTLMAALESHRDEMTPAVQAYVDIVRSVAQ